MRLLYILGALLALSLVPAFGQSADDPVATVRAFYAKDDVNASEFYSKRLKALFARDTQKAKREGGMGNLGFAFHVNGQDTEDNWQKTLRLAVVSRTENRAKVKATFKNFNPNDIRYAMVRENGRWLIDDARSLGKEKWRLSTIVAGR
jgi:hypothetical protein